MAVSLKMNLVKVAASLQATPKFWIYSRNLLKLSIHMSSS